MVQVLDAPVPQCKPTVGRPPSLQSVVRGAGVSWVNFDVHRLWQSDLVSGRSSVNSQSEPASDAGGPHACGFLRLRLVQLAI